MPGRRCVTATGVNLANGRGFQVRQAFVVAAVLIAGCAPGLPVDSTSTPNTATGGSAFTADQLVLVDCLLPGQIRQLGASRTYVTPRRPVKTTAGDCQIRGGEYVAFDRADYATALRIWLPQAEAGDPAAQNTVGEIYERGLGVAPDYALARAWYQKAAAQNFAAAEANLGYLYEKGLGGAADRKTALDYYRKATGLTDQLAYASEVVTAKTNAAGTIATLSDGLGAQTAAAEQLRRELAQSRLQLGQSRAELEAARGALDDAKRQYQDLLQTKSQGAATNDAELDRLRQEIERREQALAGVQNNLRALEQQAQTRQSDFAGKLETAARQDAELRRELDQAQHATQTLTEHLAQRELELIETRRNLNQTQLELIAQGAQYDQEKSELVAQQAALEQRQSGKLEQAGQTKARLERALDDNRRGALAAQDRIAQLEQALAAERSAQDQQAARDQAALTQQLATARQDLAASKQRANALTSQLQTQRDQQPRTAAQLESLQSNLVTTQQSLRRREARIAELERQVTDYAQQVAELESAPASSPDADFIRLARSRVDFGRDHALIIGNGNYRNLSTLASATGDAQTLDTLLRSKYGYQTTLLVDATRNAIYQQLTDYRARLTERDNLLIYFAGHGKLGTDGVQGYWLPVDADLNNSLGNWISNKELADQLRELKAKHVLIIADACYSDRLTNPPPPVEITSGDSPEAQVQRLANLARLRVRTVLRSGGEEPVPDATGDGHSIFGSALLRVLSNNTTILEGQVLASRVSAEVIASNRQLKQTPGYDGVRDAGHLFGDYLFVPSTDRPI